LALLLHGFFRSVMRKKILCAAVLMVQGAMAAPPGHPRWRDFRHKVAGAPAVARGAAGAAFGQLRNAPHEWGQGAGGFAKRFASGLGQHAVKESIELGMGAWLHENLHYQPSNLHQTWPRVEYALKTTFIVPRIDRPGKTFAVSRVSSNLGAGIISRAWQPASTAGIGAGLLSGGLGVAADVGFNMVREFWPRKPAVATKQPAAKR